MNHQLISDLARADMDERIKGVQRERLARTATPRRRHSSRILLAARGIRAGLSNWRARNQLGAMTVPMCGDGCADSPAR
jgi:hypothetical protein